MSLTLVTAANIDAYVAFLMEHGNEDFRSILAQDDIRDRIVKCAHDHILEADGEIQATISAAETLAQDGTTHEVATHIVTKTGGDTEFENALLALLDMKARDPLAAPRRYIAVDTPEFPLPLDLLRRFGFVQTTSRSKYLHDTGPVGPNELPLAEKAHNLGYVTERITRKSLDDEPALAERMAEIYNLAFAGRAGVDRRDADDIKKRLDVPDIGVIIVRREETVAGFATWIEQAEEVLAADIAVHRRHWATGAADALCLRFINEVHALFGKKIVAYADTTNKASTRMMERVGLRLIEHYPVWELLVPVRENQPTGNRF